MNFRTAFAGFLLAAFCFSAVADETLLLRQPALSQDHLAFVYAGDIWIADRSGGDARRLTSHPAEENGPVFSPDGRYIAFAAEYEDNTDVYVIPVAGGQPRRLTWHPGTDRPQGWSADGREVAFVSARETDHGRSGQWYHVSVDGGLPVRQMEARIVQGRYGPAGELAYIPFVSGYNGLFGGGSGWKGYRGGTTPAVHILSADRESVRVIPGAGATNFNPFWLGGQVYFLSDRDDKVFNLFRFDPAAGEMTRLTNETDWDVRAAGGLGDTVVYEAGGQIKRLDLASGQVETLEIRIAPDLPQLRPQWKDASGTIQAVDISRSGKRALLTARGEVFTVPVDDGSTRNLSETGGVREYTALWSPDGLHVAWIAETDDGQEVVLADQFGAGSVKRFPLGPHFYFLLAWAPGDTQRLVYQDNHLGLHVLDLASGKSERIALGTRREQYDVAVSPDGRWLAYTLERPNYHRDLVLHEFASGRDTTVSDGLADVAAPAFSTDGKVLYFAASTNSGPLQVGLNMTSQERPYRAGLYAAVLTADGASPLAPKTGDEEAEKDDNGDDDKAKDKKDEKPVTRIDLGGLDGRIVGLPVAEANYAQVQAGKNGHLFYLERVQPGVANLPPGKNEAEGNRLLRFDFEKREQSTVLEGVRDFRISSDGGHIIVRKADGSLAVAEIADELEPEPVKLGGLRVMVDPRVEWVQIFDEAWRMEKEYFYADNLHGLDWDGVYRKYRPLVDHVGRREDLNAVIVEMIAELHAGHNRAGGGDVHKEQAVKTGLLGANLETANGRYRIARVYTGEDWNPFLAAPLATPGNAARAGEYILAVNGAELTAQDNIFALLQGTVGQQVTLRVGPDASGRDARDIVVEPIDNERELRLWSWIERNRQRVEEATDGRVGYIYLPNTAGAGYTFFNRMFFAQVDKEALIIDERSNSGGQAANYIIEVLSRMHLSGWKDRDGMIYNTPAGAVHGPKLMMIDQDAGSGGDYLPFTFRLAGIGKLLGTRTWGGLIGIYANPDLMDGGRLTVPFFRFFDPQGNWSVENEGVAPDIEVPLDPVAYNRGVDSQLEAAIEEILSQLEGYESDVLQQAPPLPTELGK
ncbi:MAG: PDZ domain-containing protein [Xanthomonadales bacterium]